MKRILLLAAVLSASAPALAQQRTLLLKNGSGTTLHTIPLVGPEFLSVGDLSASSNLTLTLLSPVTGQPLHTVPLTGSEPIRINEDGQIEARCTAPTGQTSCNNLGPPQPALVEHLAISVPPPAGQPHPRVAVGQAFHIEWYSTRAEVCVGQGPQQLQGWSNPPEALQTSGTRQNLQFTAVPSTNPVTISVRCYGFGGAGDRTLTIQVG